MAGYSGTPLARKLGIKPASGVGLWQAPDNFSLGELPESVRVVSTISAEDPLDVVVAFCITQPDLAAALALRGALRTAGGLWIGWPKKASKVPTELSGDVVRAAGLATGWVDNKVCALSEVWSGLRFVRRKADR